MTDEKNVDESWKKQVEHEKAKEPPPEEQAPGEEGPPSFASLVSSLGMQAMMSLGMVQDPKSEKVYIDPYNAQYVIDLLGILEEKTKGNLTPEEDELLKGTVGELRMIFMRVMEAIRAQQVKSGGAPPAAPGTQPPTILRP